MNMKQLRVLLLLLLFLQSKIGVAFNVHYCGEHIAKISGRLTQRVVGWKKDSYKNELQLSQKSC